MKKSEKIIVTQRDIYERPLLFVKHWNRFLLSIFYNGYAVLHHYPTDEMLNELDELNIESVSKNYYRELLSDANFEIEKSGSGNTEDFPEDIAIHTALYKAMETLLFNKLIDAGEWDEAPFVDIPFAYSMRAFVLNEKGVEVALRLQEHLDNERRHSNTSSLTKRAFYVSSAALIIAGLSAWFNYQRLDLYEAELKKVSNQTVFQQDDKDSR